MNKHFLVVLFLIFSSVIYAEAIHITEPYTVFYKLLEASKTIKSDFETTDQYNERIKNNKSIDSCFYFEVKRNYSYKYDADIRQLTITSGDVWINKSNKINIVFDSECKLAKSYLATNGFGAQTKVEKWEYTKYLLMVNRSKTIENIIDSNNKCFKISISFPPDENRVKNLKLIAEFKSVNNVKMKYKESDKATFSNPEESCEFTYYGKAILSKLIIWDTLNKSIIQEYKI